MTASKKYGLFGKRKAKQGKGDELAAILIESAHLKPPMKGCLQYLVGVDPADPDMVCVSEVWETKEDHANSLKLDSVKAAIAKAMPILQGMPEKGINWQVLGGLGIDQ